MTAVKALASVPESAAQSRKCEKEVHMKVPRFDIFSGTHDNAHWIEVVATNGLLSAMTSVTLESISA